MDLPEVKCAVLSSPVERVIEHARSLDTYGDAGKVRETAEELAQLEHLLDYMRRLYPKPSEAPVC